MNCSYHPIGQSAHRIVAGPAIGAGVGAAVVYVLLAVLPDEARVAVALVVVDKVVIVGI